MTVKKDIRFRVYVAFTCICLLGVAVLFKAAHIQAVEGKKLRKMSQEMHTRTTTLPAERGNIYTEDGQLLCSTIPQFDVRIDFSVIDPKIFDEKIDSLAMCMSELFGDASKAKYKQQLTDAYTQKKRYYLLKKNLPYYQYQAVRSFPIFNRGKRRGGFIEEPKMKRINPYGMLAYRTIGLWRANSQAIGMEATYDSVLNGENGTRIEQKMTGGVWVPVDGAEVEPQDGKDLVTTLDIGIQDVAEHALMNVLQQYECLYGTCIVMEVKTGKIRALVNLGRQKDGSYWEDFNYAMIPTEPGSTFKLMTLIALLNDKYINVENKVDAQGGAMRFGNRTMRDSHLGLGVLTIRDAFAHSSNVAMAKLAYQYYYKEPDRYVKQLKKLHLHERTGIDIAGERRPLVKSPANTSWSATTLPWMAHGYEVLISPLHTAMIYNAVANDGKLMRPYLISAVREYGKNIKTFQPQVIEEAIADSDAIAQLQRCVREVAVSGTAKHIQGPFYTIAGKTGTAQVADKGIKYSDRVYQGSFVGYFPAEEPKYTVAVVVRTKPHSGAYYGGTVAAPVFRMVADKIFASSKGSWIGPLDSIAKAGNNTILAQQATARAYRTLLSSLGRKADIAPGNHIAQLVSDSTKKVKLLPGSVVKGFVPDVSGLGLKDAVYLLEKEGLNVHIQGRGKVTMQSIAPGSPAAKGQTIVLQLS